MGTEPTREANALLWRGECAAALAVLDAHVPRDDLFGLVVRIESLLFDERVEEARALFLAHREMLHAAPRGKADVAVIAAFLLLDDGALEGARTAAIAALAHDDPKDPISAAAHFCLAAIAHREGRPDEVRRRLTEVITRGGDLFVVRWAVLQWEETFPGAPLPRRRPPRAPKTLRVLGVGLVTLATSAFVAAFVWAWVGVDRSLPRQLGADVEALPQSRRDALVFAEADKLHRIEASLEGARPDHTDLYFVGAAGWSDQDVFASEVRSARALFDARFDTEGRSMVLANDVSLDTEVPVMSTTTLRHALGGVAARMQREEDVLFLFVTSHGSSDGLAIRPPRRGAFAPETLTPTGLRSMLDDAGIKWRVLVIAGCESGVFVGPLSNEHTLVATAASSDRVSYGCAMGNAFTDFGRAVFDEQLRKEWSFVTAFGNAAQVIATREEEDERIASRPQVSEGAAIREKLRELEVRLAANEPQPMTR